MPYDRVTAPQGRRSRLPARLVALLGLLLLPAALPAQRATLRVPLGTLEDRVAADSMDPAAHYDLGLAYWLSRRYDEAERHLRRAIAIEPHLAPGYLALAYLPYARRPKLWDEVRKGKVPAELTAAVEEADRFRRKAFLIDPLVDLKPLALMIPPASSFGLKGNSEAVYTYIMNGFGSFWDGQYGRAYQFFHEIGGNASEEEHQRFPSWFLWYEALAAAHANDFDRATTNLRTLLARAQSDQNVDAGAAIAFSEANHYRYTLACILDQAGRAREAIPLLEEALTVDAGLYMAHARLAAIYADQKRPQASLEERRRAVAANPDDPGLLFDLGEALARAGQGAEAYAILKQAREANPLNFRTLYVLGWAAQQVGRNDEAKDAYRSFIALAPSSFAEQKATATARLETLQ
ncbi:MAG TPA: tetratricopeptide repeat protein [Gemmatimonadales bacterium]|nr:tetratricopeptide repeat protein [Gemmatimonadales bacterium]